MSELNGFHTSSFRQKKRKSSDQLDDQTVRSRMIDVDVVRAALCLYIDVEMSVSFVSG